MCTFPEYRSRTSVPTSLMRPMPLPVPCRSAYASVPPMMVQLKSVTLLVYPQPSEAVRPSSQIHGVRVVNRVQTVALWSAAVSLAVGLSDTNSSRSES